MSEKTETTPTRPFHHGDLRNTLLAIARRLVQQHGPEGFSLREAAREAGVSPNAAYRHFTDKAALLGELARQGFREMAIEMEETMAAAGDDPVARIHANGLAYVRFAARERDLFNLMFGPFGAGAPDGMQRMLVPGPATGLGAFELLGSALDGLLKTGRLAADNRAGAEMLLWPVVHGLATLTNAHVLPAGQVEALFDLGFPMMMRAIGLPPTAPPPVKPPAPGLAATR